MPHAIRLRGPWQLVSPGGASARVRLPDDWPRLVTAASGPPAAAADAPPLVLERIFHCPTGLGPGARVDLRLRLDAATDVFLNDQRLACSPHAASDARGFDLRGLLLPTNVLRLETVIDGARQIDQSVWDVWLELDD